MDIALSLPDDSEARILACHEIALCAIRYEQDDVAEAMLGELGSAAHEAHVRWIRGRRLDRWGSVDAARDDVRLAVEAVEHADPWRPVLPDWVSPSSARADLSDLLARLSDERAAAAVAAPIPRATREHVRTVATLGRHLAPAEAWGMVNEAIAAIRSVDERARAAIALLQPDVPRPRLVPDTEAAMALIDAVVGTPIPEAENRAYLAGARVAAVLAQAFLDAPALTAAVEAWGRASQLIGQTTPGCVGAITILCDIARLQLERVGPRPAGVTFHVALERLPDAPLPPDPPTVGDWADLLRLGRTSAAFSVPLARVIARQPAVPGPWAYILGLLHIVAERPDRALKVAEVLAEAARRHDEDHESLLLSGLLRARAGAADDAWNDLLTAILERPDDTMALDGSAGPVAWDSLALDAILAGGRADLGITLARIVPAAGNRAALLARCVMALPAGEGAALLAQEAAMALAEADAARAGPPLDHALAELPAALVLADDNLGGVGLAEQLVTRLEDTALPTFLHGISLLHGGLDKLGPLGEECRAPLFAAHTKRIDEAEATEQVVLILALLAYCGSLS